MPIRQGVPTTSPTVIHTVPTRNMAVVDFISIANPTAGTTSWFKIYAVPDGEVIGDEHVIVAKVSLAPAATYEWAGKLRLSEGDTIQVEAEVTATLSVTASMDEFTLRVKR
jgi:hypothetical protein